MAMNAKKYENEDTCGGRVRATAPVTHTRTAPVCVCTRFCHILGLLT
jgi:hypothetical protein